MRPVRLKLQAFGAVRWRGGRVFPGGGGRRALQQSRGKAGSGKSTIFSALT